MSWKKVKLGEILTESKIISENPNPDRRITVRLKVLGVEKRGVENEVEGATKQYIRKAGQFIYGKQNFHKGAFGIVPPELDGFESSSDLPAFDVDKSCLPEFIFYFFKQGNFYLELSKIASGVATQRINTTQLFELELLLPDVKTQRQLISNIQLLEKNGAEIYTELTHQLTLVKKLRQQLLQDAVQGKLVEQNKKDEPASELLKKIKAEKVKLIAEKKLKKEKELPPIKPVEIPFEIPENWVWCRLGEMVNIKSGKRIHAADYRPSGVPFLRSGEIGSLGRGESLKTELYISESKFQDVKQKFGIPKAGDILIACIGGSIGNTWIVDEREFYYKDGNLVLIETIPFLNKDFLLSYLKSPFFWKNTILNATDSSYNALTIVKLNDAEFPLPPLAEQNRIVQKLDELMQYCNELEASIKQSESQNEKLLQQVLREALRKEVVN